MNFFNLPSWVGLKNSLNPIQPDPCTLLLDMHAQDFHQKILKKKKNKKNKNKNKNKTKQKATQKTLIFQVIGPAHKNKANYLHAPDNSSTPLCSQTNPLLCSISETLFLLKGRLHCLVAASNNQVRF